MMWWNQGICGEPVGFDFSGFKVFIVCGKIIHEHMPFSSDAVTVQQDVRRFVDEIEPEPVVCLAI